MHRRRRASLPSPRRAPTRRRRPAPLFLRGSWTGQINPLGSLFIASEVTASFRRNEAIATRLAEARERTLELVSPLDDEQLNRVYSPLLSPLAWDLGHIANFEELWLVRRIGAREPLKGDLGRLYDAIENPRASRNELPILRDSELRAYMEEVRARTLEVLAGVDIGPDAREPLLREAYVYEMLLAHEYQHNETMLQLLMMIDGYEPPRRDAAPTSEPASGGPEMVLVEQGTYELGAPRRGFAYDNERERHAVRLSAFEIDRTPVTNRAYMSFMEETGAEPPLYWERDGEGGWVHTPMGKRDPLNADLPVIHVSWHEAAAFASWAGKRLPSEAEWEAACEGATRERANLDQLAFAPTHAGAYSDAAADCGAVQMLGDVWEWTSSSFGAYPGFKAFPYPEYSEHFFGDDYRVLRGGAWATRRAAIRPSFRNWDLPQRRQIFAGIRCARDAE